MGIRNLCSYIFRNNLYDLDDLVSIAKQQEEMMTIIVDAEALSPILIDIALKKTAWNYSNKFLMLPVGEYKEIENIFKDFHESLKDINIELIWVVDGPKGVDRGTVEHKTTSWNSRNKERLSKYTNMFSEIELKVYKKLLDGCRPIYSFDAALKNLKECGARIINLPDGEADAYVVKIYRDEGAFAILSGDTDFVIFDSCDVILINNLIKGYRGDLNLPFVNHGSGDSIFQTPVTFECPFTNSRRIIDHLQLRDHEQLMMVAVMVGNDYTLEFAQEVATLCNVTKERDNYPNFGSVAEYIKAKNITFESYRRSMDLRNFIRSHPTFQRAVTYSREMYLSDASISYESSDELTSFLNRGLQSGDINRDCIAIHNGALHFGIYGEELSEGCEGIIAALRPLRVQVYPFLLKNDRDTVTEVMSIGGEDTVLQVVHADQKTHLIAEVEGIEIFVRIFTDGLSEIFKDYIDELRMIDSTKLFVICIISYFYKITNRVNLMVTESEFKAVFITAFFQFKSVSKGFQPILDNGTLMRLEICPSPRCVTIATWVMVLYKTVLNIYGGALNITRLFPPPSTIMKGSVLFAFFETMDPDNERTHHLDTRTLESIDRMKEGVMVEFQDIYDLITN